VSLPFIALRNIEGRSTTNVSKAKETPMIKTSVSGLHTSVSSSKESVSKFKMILVPNPRKEIKTAMIESNEWT